MIECAETISVAKIILSIYAHYILRPHSHFIIIIILNTIIRKYYQFFSIDLPILNTYRAVLRVLDLCIVGNGKKVNIILSDFTDNFLGETYNFVLN